MYACIYVRRYWRVRNSTSKYETGAALAAAVIASSYFIFLPCLNLLLAVLGEALYILTPSCS